jgi:hypothetical protein
LSLQWPLSKEGELPWYAKLITAKESWLRAYKVRKYQNSLNYLSKVFN